MSAIAALCAGAMVLPACSDGGGGGGSFVRPPPWSSLQHDTFRSGVTSGEIENNPGTATRLFQVGVDDTTPSSPAISLGGVLYVGTRSGLLAVTTDGDERWRFDGYEQRCQRTPAPCGSDADCAPDTCGGCLACTPGSSAGCTAVGAITASPTISASNDIVVGTNQGHIFALRDEGGTVTCRWVARADDRTLGPVRSSAGAVVNSQTGTFSSVFTGTDEGFLLALDALSGQLKWRFPTSGSLGPITSSPAVGGDGSVYFTTGDGAVQGLSPLGQQRWRVQVGAPPEEAPFLASAALGPSIYATGTTRAGGVVLAVNFDGSVKWRYPTTAPILGSPAYVQRTVPVTATSTVTPGPPPTPTPTPNTTIATVVYAVDRDGTLYGIRDANGNLVGRTPFAGAPPGVDTSLVLSADLYALVVGTDGRLYGSNLAGMPPCNPCDDGTPSNWPVDLGVPVRSSPVIDSDGTIYVTAGDGWLWAIGAPSS